MTTSADISIRRAEAADAATIARLGAATFTETFGHLYQPEDLQAFLSSSRSEERYVRMLESPRTGLWLAVANGNEPIGYAVAGACKLPVENLEPDAGEVQELYVISRYHGRRLGTTLLETALEWLEAERFSPLYVGVWSENFGAQRLYGRYGFEKVGEYGFPVGDHIDREFILRRFR
ncbi:MAG TPA: GNAT family N-acetyltransferase [Steroidobacteraceae bacterium]|jgi:ribosomal protein S18 acetylase RimI-like enzyme